MKGSELKDYLGKVGTLTGGGYPQFGGIKMEVNCSAKSVIIDSIGGKSFDENATYSFAIPSFSASGGDKYPIINTVNAGLVDAGVLKDYLAAKEISMGQSIFLPARLPLSTIFSIQPTAATVAKI